MEFIEEPFKKVIKYKSGYTWSKEQELREYENGSIRVLTVTNIQKKLDLTSELYLQNVPEKDKVEKAVAKNWSIAVSSNGNRSRIGNAVFIEENESYLFASFLTAFTPKNINILDPKYFHYWLMSFPIQERISSVSEGTTGLGNLDIRFLRNLNISFPKKIPEQQAIAGILTKVDEAINATRQSIKATQKLKKALMQNLLTGKMKPDGSFRTEDEFYEDEKYGKVPKGWEIKKVKECFDYFPTASYSRSKTTQEGELMYIHYGDIHKKFNRVIDVNNEKLPFVPIELAKKYQKVKEGDIIFADASEDWNGVGKCVEILNLTNQKIISGLHTLHLRPKTNDFILGFASYLFETYRISTNIKRLATGIKVYGISKPNLSRVLLPVPKEDEQIEIRNQLDTLFNKGISAERKIKSLEKLKKSLMQHLLTGKKRVDVVKVNQLLKA